MVGATFHFSTEESFRDTSDVRQISADFEGHSLNDPFMTRVIDEAHPHTGSSRIVPSSTCHQFLESLPSASVQMRGSTKPWTIARSLRWIHQDVRAVISESRTWTTLIYYTMW